MGDCVESLAEVKADNIHGSPLIYPASHAIVESYQIGQAWFPLGESMLTTPDNLLFLHLLNEDLKAVKCLCQVRQCLWKTCLGMGDLILFSKGNRRNGILYGLI